MSIWCGFRIWASFFTRKIYVSILLRVLINQQIFRTKSSFESYCALTALRDMKFYTNSKIFFLKFRYSNFLLPNFPQSGKQRERLRKEWNNCSALNFDCCLTRPKYGITSPLMALFCKLNKPLAVTGFSILFIPYTVVRNSFEREGLVEILLFNEISRKFPFIEKFWTWRESLKDRRNSRVYQVFILAPTWAWSLMLNLCLM